MGGAKIAGAGVTLKETMNKKELLRNYVVFARGIVPNT